MVKIGGIDIEPGVMNAACNVAKSPEDVAALARTRIGAIVVGSITLEARKGNSGSVWYASADRAYALNSYGMPNKGADYYRQVLPTMLDTAHAANKKLILSIAGFCLDDYARLAELANTAEVDILELNLGCPNIQTDDGKPELIASFDQEYMSEIISEVVAETDIPISLKLSPYSNSAELESTAKLINRYSSVHAVVSSNTFPNGSLPSPDGYPVLSTGYGGVSGAAMLPIALGQVHQFYEHLDRRIKVIGAGGIETRQDVERFFQMGASAVQAATLIVRDGHDAINRLV